MNIAITPTAETLIQHLSELGHDTPEAIVEQALQCFYDQQFMDISLGFPELSGDEIIQSNEQRWQLFQQNPNGISQSNAEAQFLS